MAIDSRLPLRRRQIHPRPAVGGRPPAGHERVDQLPDRPGSAGPSVVPGIEDLDEDPLGPPIVRRFGGGDAAARVMGQAQPAELATVIW
jgi:hypothetical protein